MKKISIGFAVFFLIVSFSWNKTGAEPLKTTGTDYLSGLPEVKKYKMKNDVNLLYIKDDLPVTTLYATISYGKIDF